MVAGNLLDFDWTVALMIIGVLVSLIHYLFLPPTG
jgi:hypothetical protein